MAIELALQVLAALLRRAESDVERVRHFLVALAEPEQLQRFPRSRAVNPSKRAAGAGASSAAGRPRLSSAPAARGDRYMRSACTDSSASMSSAGSESFER